MASEAYKSLEQIFTNQISVLNIAVPVVAVSLEQAKIECYHNNYDYHLVKEPSHNGLMVFERKSGILRNITDSEIIADSTPIIEVMETLCDQDHLFVKVKRNITHLVARSDLDSIPVRIWLFGMINLFEIELRNWIESSGLIWEVCLSTGRLEKANMLFQEKQRNNEEITLLGCLQLIDLGVIIQKQPRSPDQTLVKFDNRKSADTIFKKINRLRDSLAHGQKIQMEWCDVYHLMQLIANSINN